ncbi:hypothetical protein VOLCADRAFT_86264 [Volvox carteri f. nagariensis]|uniref:mannan endo-1,4-beta-mannosidase n=1 Tax=Volvox carteri f. nagariensis TaxID=3068 RepID=D8TIB9_VOLCA|nr:uncharacterized protein VOLCADRAFT_86264 [Volvox carteri f. nagariensis]EFJ52864.1 hypothetical protein VOLCADRAFT_86264 [Volvox carteri f. nagariensis]|eukprot:XP_002945869.1 hypothetical protein VOLCADRAFT_86264 [Volvox carteri f. nagariensis]
MHRPLHNCCFAATYLAALILTLFTANAPRTVAFSFGGANSYYLYTFRTADQIQVLDAMQAAGFRTLRISIAAQGENQTGSNNYGVPDVEHPVGMYDDRILTMIDDLITRAFQRGIKLIITLHDRYSLGCWGNNAYVDKYNIPTTNACGYGGVEDNDLNAFYNNANAAADMDRRFTHIISHRHPGFSNRPWSAIPEAILGFDIQNEGQAHQRNGNIPNPNWICERAKKLKPQLSSGMLVLTGAGADVWDSVLSQHFACSSIDVVCVHSYMADDWSSKLPPVIQAAKQDGKRIIVEGFGATGWGSKAAGLQKQIDVFQNLGVPWMVWQVVKPNNYDNYEVFTDDTDSWSVLSSAARAAPGLGGAFVWPEFTGGSTKHPPPPKAAGKRPPPPKVASKRPPPPKVTSKPPPPTNNKCAKCNIPLCRGGCKCDNNCDCRPGLGGATCDKCNLPQDQGGCVVVLPLGIRLVWVVLQLNLGISAKQGSF